MLEFLRIRDLALIEDMELEFDGGLNVLTGETGAGKSFIVKALGFLLGDRLVASMVRPGCERASVEGIFRHGDEELLIRRELLGESGRSRLYINDQLRSQESLRDLRASLVVHTSQHSQQQLLQPAWQARVLDACLPDPALLEQRDKLHKALLEVSRNCVEIEEKFQNLSDRRDVLEMQRQAIEQVAPEAGEEERLEARREELRHLSAQAALHESALRILQGEDGGLEEHLGKLQGVLEELAAHDAHLTAFLDEVAALRADLPALERHLRHAPQAGSPEELDAIEARLYALAQLKRKLRRPLEAILRLHEEIGANLSFLDECSLDLHRLHREEAALAAELRTCLERLIPARRAAGTVFAKTLQEHLKGLGFSKDVRVLVDYSPAPLLTLNGESLDDERPRLLWAPNPGHPPQPLDKIASGGELSRFLLALVSMQDVDADATYILDEVDAGVGGVTLQHLAARLQELAARRQMILITHWPQLAALASRHFSIIKEECGGVTCTRCTPLDATQRAAELSRMMGGGAQGEAVARTLLEGA